MVVLHKRKNIVHRSHRSTIPEKNPREMFQSYVNEAKRQRDTSPEDPGPLNEFMKWVQAARAQVPTPQSNITVVGKEVFDITELQTRNDYLKIKVDGHSGMYFILRKIQTTAAIALRIQETNFELQCIVPEGLHDITLTGFMGGLWEIFEKIFNNFMTHDVYDQICFHATHRELEGSLSSSIFSLIPENRDKIIYEIMSKLSAWNESSKIGSTMREINLAVTLLNRNLPGNGKTLLAVGDSNLRRKAFTRNNYTGSILYVDCEENCFFVAIYLCLIYNKFSEAFKNTNSKKKKMKLHQTLFETVEKKGHDLIRYLFKTFK